MDFGSVADIYMGPEEKRLIHIRSINGDNIHFNITGSFFDFDNDNEMVEVTSIYNESNLSFGAAKYFCSRHDFFCI